MSDYSNVIKNHGKSFFWASWFLDKETAKNYLLSMLFAGGMMTLSINQKKMLELSMNYLK